MLVIYAIQPSHHATAPVDHHDQFSQGVILEGRCRVVIERIQPAIEEGRFPAKRIAGEELHVEADIFADGHDQLAAAVRYRLESGAAWNEVPLTPTRDDRWHATLPLETVGRYVFSIQAWIDPFGTWRRDLLKRLAAGQPITAEFPIGAMLIEEAARRATGPSADALRSWAGGCRASHTEADLRRIATSEDLAELMRTHAERRFAVETPCGYPVVVDRPRARFSTWYELFPRSCAREAEQSGTLRDCAARLAEIAAMGFDVLYLPPIHPIGTTARKGRNNHPEASPGDPGSPWAIGAVEGGHTAIHPELGTLADFRALIQQAREVGIEIALDLAFQCSPDHPFVREHPEWFRHRPDGSIRFAENPPKQYQDIYPLDFETENWSELWQELKGIVDYWIAQGITIFRVDNPHTKPFAFWEWLIERTKAEHPEVLFLSEAFTRPKVMNRLAKLGFSQSYCYFPWRNTKTEITDYFTELTQSDVREYFRPSLWPNTPDILTEYLQFGGRPAFLIRLVLAATLGASYGIYGPAYELGMNQPIAAGREEYRDSEKYEIKHWNLDRAESLRSFITRVNRIRRENPALQADRSLRFHAVDNEQIIAYSKQSPDRSNVILTVVNLDPYHRQSGWIDLGIEHLGLTEGHPYQVHDQLSNARFLWQGRRNYLELDPSIVPTHIFRVRRHLRTEHDFEYFL